MNKTELVEKIAAGAGLSKADAKKALDATVAAIKDALVKGDKVALIGFGTFSVNERPARLRRLLSSRLALSSLMLSKPDIVNKNLGVPIGTPFSLSALWIIWAVCRCKPGYLHRHRVYGHSLRRRHEKLGTQRDHRVLQDRANGLRVSWRR